MKAGIPGIEAALDDARKAGRGHLVKIYERMLYSLRPPVERPVRVKPKVVFVVDHKGWCGERLSLSLLKRLPEFECHIVRLGDNEHLSFDADLYFYRNVSWLTAVSLPQYILNRTISLLESTRILESKYASCLGDVAGIIPLNAELFERAKAYNPKHLHTPIANGIEVDEFKPAAKFPEEFTVGASGNFSLDWYDDWKGFSKYIVPACKKAGVKLSWCGWRGMSKVSGLTAKQVPMHEMPEFYRSLSCFVSMSKSEACSGVTFEAMATGLPVISTCVGWHGENCTGNEIIWTSRPKPENETVETIQAAIDELAAKLIRLKNDRNAQQIFGNNARAFAERFSWDNLIDPWREALRFYVDRFKDLP